MYIRPCPLLKGARAGLVFRFKPQFLCVMPCDLNLWRAGFGVQRCLAPFCLYARSFIYDPRIYTMVCAHTFTYMVQIICVTNKLPAKCHFIICLGRSPFWKCAWSHGPMCPRVWRLGVGGTLTILQFVQLFGCARVLGLNTNLEHVLGSSTQRCVLANQFQQG
jgi:hypothetical protein